MANIHLVLQGKGGVGKSLISAFLAQHRLENGLTVIGIDTDPVNTSFSRFSQLQVEPLRLLNDGEIDPSQFDKLMEQFLGLDDGVEIVVDNGAASFVPICDYLLKNQAIDLLQSEDHLVLVHTVVTGGPAFLDTLSGFDSIVSQFPNHAAIVLWINPYFGDVDNRGKPFDEIHVIQKHRQSLFGMIYLPKHTGLFADDLRGMLENHRTFEEIKDDSSLGFMNRRRLSLIREALFSAMDPVLGKLAHARS